MTDDPVTHEQYIERWEQALRVLESMTEHERRLHFDMTSWGKQTHCGTVACLAGHCSLDLWFRERGFSGQVDETGLYFTGADPDDFFGDVGETNVFLRLTATYEQTIAHTKNHIEYLKKGGRP